MKQKEKKSVGHGQIDVFDEIIVDNFAGGGGASTGIELAAGRVVNIAINHDPDAILMHRTNHPYTEHIQASVWDVDPEEVCRGRPVGLAWFSPDCKHFSKAKGAALVDRNIRGLAWIVLRWAGIVRPRVIILENVEEFVTWGPVRKGRPVKKLSGKTFLQWKSQLEALGYNVEHRELVAADYGAPTTRKRFVLIARCDGRPIVWPERTHAPRDSEEVKSGKLLPWRSAAEIIDWSVPRWIAAFAYIDPLLFCPAIIRPGRAAPGDAPLGVSASRHILNFSCRLHLAGNDVTALLDVIVQLTPLPVVRGQLLHLFPPVKAVQRHQPVEHPLSQDGISHELIPAQVILKRFLCEVGARHTGRVLGTLEVSNRCIHITHCSDLPLS